MKLRAVCQSLISLIQDERNKNTTKILGMPSEYQAEILGLRYKNEAYEKAMNIIMGYMVAHEGDALDALLKRRMMPIKDYRKWDADGWSKDIVLGVKVSNSGQVQEVRLGDLYNCAGETEFYDTEGRWFDLTHVIILEKGDFYVGKNTFSATKRTLWKPTEEQIKALSKVAKNDELKQLLKDLKKQL